MEKQKIITTSHKDKELSIGDKLYRYIAGRGMSVYEVCGLLDDSILVKSTFCKTPYKDYSDHPCIVEINKVDGWYDTYKYVEMMQTCGIDTRIVTDENGEEVEIDDSYFWHKNGYYYVSKKRCAEDYGRKMIANYKEETTQREYQIKKLEDEIESRNEFIKDMEL